jgi:hypothetical protein
MTIPCGIYRTTAPIEDLVPAGVLVYYHNHGDPGPGVYLPKSWRNNRALFHDHGTTIPDVAYAETLQPLLPEGFYRVAEAFFCCSARCQYFEQDLLVQLGYNGNAEAILFVPELVAGALAVPAKGTIVDDERLRRLVALKVPSSAPSAERASQGPIH